MKPKIILIDMDGVLCQYDEKLLRLAHERFGLPLYRPSEVSQFNTEEVFPQEYRERVSNMDCEQGFFADLKPYEGAVDAIKDMAKDPRLSVFICTAPKRFYKNRFCITEKNEWIARFLGKEWTDRVILTRDKTLVHGDVLIDDKPEVFGEAKPSWVHVYHDQAYNGDPLRPRITSWKDWKEVLLPILYP